MKDKLRAFWKKTVYVVSSPFRLFRMLCLITGFLVLSVTAASGVYIYHFFRSLPPLHSMKFDTLKTLAQKRTASRLENKQKLHPWVSLRDVHRDYLYAIVLSEDSTFFEHPGIDLEAMLNSMAYNILKKKYEYGGSTISQQVAKNLFLTSEKSLTRKIKELLITEKLEKHFSKNEILELYFNLAELGPDLYGIRAASLHYFKKLPSEINAAEGAYIALMLPSPRKLHYAIYENGNLAPSKRKKLNRILRDMLANEFISYQQYRYYSKYKFSENTGPNRSTASSKARLKKKR